MPEYDEDLLILARSNALARLAKMSGITAQILDPSWLVKYGDLVQQQYDSLVAEREKRKAE